MARSSKSPEQLEKKYRQKMFQQVGEYLSQKRQESNLKQADIAKASGYSSQFISNIECGTAFPPPNLLATMIEVYQLPEKDFLDTLMHCQLQYYREVFFVEAPPASRARTRVRKKLRAS